MLVCKSLNSTLERSVKAEINWLYQLIQPPGTYVYIVVHSFDMMVWMASVVVLNEYPSQGALGHHRLASIGVEAKTSSCCIMLLAEISL